MPRLLIVVLMSVGLAPSVYFAQNAEIEVNVAAHIQAFKADDAPPTLYDSRSLRAMKSGHVGGF